MVWGLWQVDGMARSGMAAFQAHEKLSKASCCEGSFMIDPIGYRNCLKFKTYSSVRPRTKCVNKSGATPCSRMKTRQPVMTALRQLFRQFRAATFAGVFLVKNVRSPSHLDCTSWSKPSTSETILEGKNCQRLHKA